MQAVKNIKKQEVIYNDEISFNILGKKINLISEEINEIKYTVANYEKKYFHLGNTSPDINAAIKFYEIFFQHNLSKKEISKILEDNK